MKFAHQLLLLLVGLSGCKNAGPPVAESSPATIRQPAVIPQSSYDRSDRDYHKLVRRDQITASASKRLESFRQQGQILLLSGDPSAGGELEAWSVTNWKLDRKLRDHLPLWTEFSNGAGTVVEGNAGVDYQKNTDFFDVHVRDVMTGNVSASLHSETGFLSRIAVSPDLDLLATADGVFQHRPPFMDDNGNLILWSLRTGERVSGLHQVNSVMTVAFSPDGKNVAFATRNGSVYAYEIQNRDFGRLLLQAAVLANSTGENRERQFSAIGQGNVEFSSDSKLLASGTKMELNIWRVDTGRPVQKVNSPCEHVALAPNGKTAACDNRVFSKQGPIERQGWEPTIKLFDLESGRLVFTIRGYGDPIFSADGRTLLAISADTRIAGIWSAE